MTLLNFQDIRCKIQKVMLLLHTEFRNESQLNMLAR
jgi:hypothetical protein